MPKLKKAHLVYFVQKDSPKAMDYRFDYQRTPEAALKFRIGQWWRNPDTGKLVKHMLTKGYDTREEAEALVDKYNEDLIKACPWRKFEKAKR